MIGREGEFLRLGFRKVDDYRPQRWKDPVHPQQIHLDIYVDDPAGHPIRLGVEGQ
ncbi:hypothetical protein [Actinopolymorpha alba]|uniref:hypothetical protein n=1 Tax=Actinopolymorpha alba TaxID=533267 RepID=UPI0003722A28|nr:hypothetical protein [Actinopolymorpha alba]